MGTLRILLALSVVAGHTSGFLGNKLLSTGDAVHLFFVVSGFYMALILTGKYQDLGAFYLNRVLRLWPTYLVVLAATIAWFYFCWFYTGKHPPPLWVSEAYQVMPWWQAVVLRVANFTMVGLEIPFVFFYRPEVGFLFVPFEATVPADAQRASLFVEIGQAWSISMELWFYLLAPFLVKRSVAFLMALIVASIAMNLWGASHGFPVYFLFPAQLYLFVMGMLVYKFYASRRAAVEAHPLGPVLMCVLVCAILVYQWIPQTIAPYFIFALCVPAIPWLFSYFRSIRWDTELGNLSYAIYLSHHLVIQMLATAFGIHNGLIVAGVTILLSLAIYLLIEKPIDRVRQSIASRSMKEGAFRGAQAVAEGSG